MKIKYFDVYEKDFVMPEGEQVDIRYSDDSANITYNGARLFV